MGALKAIATILTMIVAAALIGIAGGLWWMDHSAKKLAVTEQAKAGAATVGQGQAQAQTAAQQIIVSGQARDHLDIQLHQDNANAIAHAPGASDALDPTLLRTARLGLCKHAAYAADPGCARLREPDPPVVPKPGPAGATDFH